MDATYLVKFDIFLEKLLSIQGKPDAKVANWFIAGDVRAPVFELYVAMRPQTPEELTNLQGYEASKLILEIVSVCVSAENRNKGIFQTVLARCINFAATHNMGVCLQVSKPIIRHVCKRDGFLFCGTMAYAFPT